MTRFERLILALFATLSQVPPYLVFVGIKDQIELESLGVLLSSLGLSILGLYFLAFLLLQYLRGKMTPKNELELPLLAAFFTSLTYFIAFFWLIVEIKTFLTVRGNIIWLFPLAHLLPIVVSLVLVALLSSPETYLS